LLLLNEYKFNDFFLIKFKELLKKIFNKNVEFRIISLKKLHLNSDMFLQSLIIKLKNRKNNIYKVLKKSFKLVNLPFLNKYVFLSSKINFFNLISLGDYIFFNKNFKLKNTNKKTLRKHIFKNLKHKYINGIKIESKGRLTKRLTAQKSVFKSKSKGNLKNIYLFNNISVSLLKGYFKSNLQYTNINSKNRNGSFGLKG
jgi:hypothetical protein